MLAGPMTVPAWKAHVAVCKMTGLLKNGCACSVFQQPGHLMRVKRASQQVIYGWVHLPGGPVSAHVHGAWNGQSGRALGFANEA